jgi:molybdate transport system substrate-binding protein
MVKRFIVGFLLLLSSAAPAAEITVTLSGGLSPVLEAVKGGFEAESGHKLRIVRGGSLGGSPNAIPERLERGEPADVLVMVGDGLEALARRGHAIAASRVDIAKSSIAMGVKAGSPRPDISTVEALKAALLEAKAVAISRSASGVYIETVLYPRLGIADEMRPKTVKATDELVGHVLLRGEASIGFQQLSEIRAVPGVEPAGFLPGDTQKITLFSAGMAAKAVEREAGRALIDYLISGKVREAIVAAGLEPLDR